MIEEEDVKFFEASPELAYSRSTRSKMLTEWVVDPDLTPGTICEILPPEEPPREILLKNGQIAMAHANIEHCFSDGQVVVVYEHAVIDAYVVYDPTDLTAWQHVQRNQLNPI